MDRQEYCTQCILLNKEKRKQYKLDNKEKIAVQQKKYGLNYRLDNTEIIKAKAKKKYQLKKAQNENE